MPADNAGANDDAEELVGADHADVHSTLDTLLDQEDISAVIQYLTSKALVQAGGPPTFERAHRPARRPARR